MTITEKFAKLTPEQSRKFIALENGAELDAFLSNVGLELTDEEKAQVLEFIESGKMQLSDEDIENAAGGFKNSSSFKWVNTPKGFGYISDPKAEEEFLKYSGLDMKGFKELEESNQ